MIDKFGECPACKKNWNRGDIKNCLSRLDIFKMASEKEIAKIAGKYFGWTEEEKKNFSKVTTIALEDGREFYECHNPVCKKIFEASTGEEFKSIPGLLAGNLTTNPIESVHNDDIFKNFFY